MTIEVTAKKVEDAIKQGLEQLGASLDEVNVEILESGGLFRKAKVRLTIERAEPKQQAPATEQPKSRTKAQPEKEPQKQPEQDPPKKEVKKSEQKQSEPKPKQRKETLKSEQKTEKTEKTESGKTSADNADRENSRPARTSAEIKQAQANATEFIATLIQKMGFTDANVTNKENGDIQITAPAGDDSLIIGRHGETLSAISFLAETLGRAEKQHVNIVADCNGYRERRAASLTAMAHRRASECAAKHRKIKLEPMERVDRRTIHNALTDDDRVTTVSEGKEPYRYIVILPKN